ncbi:AAA family ATPase [Marinicrinis lubricantis]|uniref:AAA family ATPase n=1 Tax=Marinicrinis lubricantis TaxID=2086470 RepID=A0ABW1IQU0_9BACL
MIIWINGALGASKTQTSFELHRRIPQSYVFDPENAGYYIRKNVPPQAARIDFQDFPVWRETVYGMLKHINAEYNGMIIVPMTIVNPDYFDQIIGRLRHEGIMVRHFALCASKEVLLKRLRSRGDGRSSWAAHQMDRCIQGLSNPIFHKHLYTDSMTIEDTVESIAADLKIQLTADNRGTVKKAWDRFRIKLDHIRFFN